MSKDPAHPARGLATATYSGLAVVGLATLALVGASSSATPSAHEAEGARPASASARQGEPPSATRAIARRVGRRFLAMAVLPPGTRRLAGQRVPADLRHPAETIGAKAYADVGKVFAADRSVHAVIAFLDHHHPKGMPETGYGQFGLGHSGTVREVTYSPRKLPAGFQEINLLVEVARGDKGRADVRTDVELVWFPPRSAAEHLTPGDFTSVTISAVVYGTGVTHAQHTFRQRAIIDKLARVLNSAPASPGGWMSCPVIRETYTLTFTPVKGDPGVTVGAVGCFAYTVTVGGHPQPALADSGRIESIAHSLMKPWTD